MHGVGLDVLGYEEVTLAVKAICNLWIPAHSFWNCWIHLDISAEDPCLWARRFWLCRGHPLGQQLVVRWAQEQIQGARQAMQATADLLRKLKKDAEKTKQVRCHVRAMRLPRNLGRRNSCCMNPVVGFNVFSPHPHHHR